MPSAPMIRELVGTRPELWGWIVIATAALLGLFGVYGLIWRYGLEPRARRIRAWWRRPVADVTPIERRRLDVLSEFGTSRRVVPFAEKASR